MTDRQPPPASAMEEAWKIIAVFLNWADNKPPPKISLYKQEWRQAEAIAAALTAAKRQGYDGARNLLDSVRTYPDAVRLLDANHI